MSLFVFLPLDWEEGSEVAPQLFATYHTAPEQEPGLICSLELPKDSALMGSCMSQSVQAAVTK